MLKHIKLEDIPESSRYIAEAIGLESYLILASLVGGESFYMPTISKLVKGHRNRLIKEKFKGDYAKLGREFGLSSSQIKQIIKE